MLMEESLNGLAFTPDSRSKTSPTGLGWLTELINVAQNERNIRAAKSSQQADIAQRQQEAAAKLKAAELELQAQKIQADTANVRTQADVALSKNKTMLMIAAGVLGVGTLVYFMRKGKKNA